MPLPAQPAGKRFLQPLGPGDVDRAAEVCRLPPMDDATTPAEAEGAGKLLSLPASAAPAPAASARRSGATLELKAAKTGPVCTLLASGRLGCSAAWRTCRRE